VNHEMKTRICTFVMAVGVALVVGALLVLGPSRFMVASSDITGTCSSVFQGRTTIWETRTTLSRPSS
jgi:hypothetical protein